LFCCFVGLAMGAVCHDGTCNSRDIDFIQRLIFENRTQGAGFSELT
jgi:hypothetical protein